MQPRDEQELALTPIDIGTRIRPATYQVGDGHAAAKLRGDAMVITFPFIVAVTLAGPLTIAANPPKFNVEPACKAAVAIDKSIDLAVSQDYKSCMVDEESARQELFQSWSKYDAREQTRCMGQTEIGGFPSYVEVLECLLVTVNVGDPPSRDQ